MVATLFCYAMCAPASALCVEIVHCLYCNFPFWTCTNKVDGILLSRLFKIYTTNSMSCHSLVLLLGLLWRLIFRKHLRHSVKALQIIYFECFVNIHKFTNILDESQESNVSFVKWKNNASNWETCLFPRQSNMHPLACMFSERKLNMNDRQQTLSFQFLLRNSKAFLNLFLWFILGVATI